MKSIKSAVVKPIIVLLIFMIVIIFVEWIVLRIVPSFYPHVVAIQVVLFGMALVVTMIYLMLEGQKINNQLIELNKYIDGLRNNKTVKPHLTYFQSVIENVESLNNKNKETLNIFHDAAKEFEMFGSTKIRLQSSEAASYNKTLDNINKKVFDSLNAIREAGDLKISSNNLWEDMRKTARVLQLFVKEKKQQEEETLEFLIKLRVGDYSVRLFNNQEIAKHINVILATNEGLLRELTKVAENHFTIKLEGEYPIGLSDFKASFNRGIDTNNNNITKMKNSLEEFGSREKRMQQELSLRTPSNRITRPSGASNPLKKFADIDFAGKGFGKY
ncbi:MAG: hypothetical protein FWG63_06715 [Defluviitaleaceae bacterium]|nr:hypothetical protein [Defluviitaleaceae bacterium]